MLDEKTVRKRHKTCTKCGEKKTVANFYYKSTVKDKLTGRCKPCINADCKNSIARNLKRYRDSCRRYNASRDPVKTALQKRRSHKKRKPQIRLYAKRFRQERPEIVAAYRVLRSALSSGMLVRPKRCSACKKLRKPIEASHSDYSKPLSVQWLCVPCHRRLDMARRMEREAC